MMQHRVMIGQQIGIARDGESERQHRLSRLRMVAESSCERRWFAVRVMTGRETAVEKQLLDMAIEALVPMRKGPDLRRRHRVIPGSMIPVIHGYVLVNMPADGVLLAGLSGLEHVISVVGGYETPMPITAEEVRRFKAMADQGAYDWSAPTGKSFRSGDVVRIYDGPFVGFAGEVISCRSDGRGDVVLVLDMLGGKVPVTVPLAICEKL
ncbi:transcription termination/antitermination NusG family protein [Rhizobium sp. CSW-27]|uniref:transcription termination/antitermination protein NusG n=1 Tax=Rhizobium sp. CSW-27 TaxID=2839985 RepID=UPI001C017628|nr:transcription termination/antitermination NusG family protein [Rhizobium sp. CSW-27]MBT9370289.1 antitermination protein NusG [Rhizobium sp. CSW-27]